MKLNNHPAWRALEEEAKRLCPQHLRQLFAENPARFAQFSLRHDGLLIDFSKQRIDAQALSALQALSKVADLDGWKSRMLAGEAINHTEGRAVRHIELRAGNAAPEEVRLGLNRMKRFCTAVHEGLWRGYSGERITDVVNIGIGGSDLGPRMVVKALSAHQQPDLAIHFVSNLDSADIAPLLAQLNPRTTLFIVASKTFTTLETLTNAETARNWLIASTTQKDAISRHFVALSSNVDAAEGFGIPADNVFEFRDWVGGRFSLWSVIGLSITLSIGWRNFELLLSGAHAMDRHFIEAPADSNLPLTLALLTLWNTNFLGASTHAVLPYSQSLAFLPAYLQQLEMESNGKQCARDGTMLSVATSPVLWGEAGTNGQHSFFQLFHQGGRILPSDFILLGKSDYPLPGHHQKLLANCLAQSAALAFGQTAQEAESAGTPSSLVPYNVFPGNQPSTTIILPSLSPYTLGQLLALYEHKVFCLGVLWNLNSFDQWGVELGKQLANQLTPLLGGEGDLDQFDASTRGLIEVLREPAH